MPAGGAISDRIGCAAIFAVVVMVAPWIQAWKIDAQTMQRLLRTAEAPDVGRDAISGKESFYARRGFHKMTTAMARFTNPGSRRRAGCIE